MADTRQQVADFWDHHVAAWLAGDDELPEPLDDWFACYQGKGLGAVTRDGFPEPYLGDLVGYRGDPRVVILGLNPGRFHPSLQARDGTFADEIRVAGSYSRWAATGPYFGTIWTNLMRKNRYWTSRLRFTRDWLDEPAADHQGLLIFECYPWHSTAVTAAMKPPPTVIDRFIWQPIAELPVATVFAFGRPWADLATTLDLTLLDKLGRDGRGYGSAVTSRAVRVYRLPAGQRLVVAWHSGGAGPPNTNETGLLRQALGQPPSTGATN